MLEILVVVGIGAYSYYMGYKRGCFETEKKLKTAIWHASRQMSPEGFKELSNLLKKGKNI